MTNTEKANSIFANNLEADKLFMTADGMFFTEQHNADGHSQRQVNREVETFLRKDSEVGKAEAKAQEAAKAAKKAAKAAEKAAQEAAEKEAAEKEAAEKEAAEKAAQEAAEKEAAEKAAQEAKNLNVVDAKEVKPSAKKK